MLMAVGSFRRGLRSSDWLPFFRHSLLLILSQGSCRSVLLASELASEHLKSRNVLGIVSPHPWLNTRITKVLVNTSVASLPPEPLIGQVLGGARVQPCWPRGQGHTHHLCELLSETGRSHASAMWLNFYLRHNSGIHFLSC